MYFRNIIVCEFLCKKVNAILYNIFCNPQFWFINPQCREIKIFNHLVVCCTAIIVAGQKGYSQELAEGRRQGREEPHLLAGKGEAGWVKGRRGPGRLGRQGCDQL